jgi:hypothetical protein
MVSRLAAGQDKIPAPARNNLVTILHTLSWFLRNETLLQAHNDTSSYYWLEIKYASKKQMFSFHLQRYYICLITATHYLHWPHCLHMLMGNMPQPSQHSQCGGFVIFPSYKLMTVNVIYWHQVTNWWQSMSYTDIKLQTDDSQCHILKSSYKLMTVNVIYWNQVTNWWQSMSYTEINLQTDDSQCHILKSRAYFFFRLSLGRCRFKNSVLFTTAQQFGEVHLDGSLASTGLTDRIECQ